MSASIVSLDEHRKKKIVAVSPKIAKRKSRRSPKGSLAQIYLAVEAEQEKFKQDIEKLRSRTWRRFDRIKSMIDDFVEQEVASKKNKK